MIIDEFASCQAALWDEPEPERELTIQERFEIFHKANPGVYAWLGVQALIAYEKGKKVSIKCLWEMLRWHLFIELDVCDDFKLNNNYTSRYARLIMKRVPELDGYFELRELRS